MPQYIAADCIGFRCAMSRLGSKAKNKKRARHKRKVKLKTSIFNLDAFFFTMENSNQIYNAYLESSGVSIDSRSIKKGSLFLH